MIESIIKWIFNFEVYFVYKVQNNKTIYVVLKKLHKGFK
jgi:hypothetical protein